jgi:hypothetical protein
MDGVYAGWKTALQAVTGGVIWEMEKIHLAAK